MIWVVDLAYSTLWTSIRRLYSLPQPSGVVMSPARLCVCVCVFGSLSLAGLWKVPGSAVPQTVQEAKPPSVKIPTGGASLTLHQVELEIGVGREAG